MLIIIVITEVKASVARVFGWSFVCLSDSRASEHTAPFFVKGASYLMKHYTKTKLSPDSFSWEYLGNTQSNSLLKWKKQTKIIMMKATLDSK